MNKLKCIFQSLKKLAFIFFTFVCFFSFQDSLFAEIRIVSPATDQSRVWANKQVLVINATENEEIFYSFSEDNPLKSGFAYDGPVLLDVVGNVKLKIACINKKNECVEYVLDYTVDESLNKNLSSLEESEFIKTYSSSDITTITSGEEINIPNTFEYAIDANGKKAKFNEGRPICISKDSNLERYFSLTVKSKLGIFWNFVIHSQPQSVAEFSKTAVPFEFIEWSKIEFNDSNYIYSVDDGWWQSVGKIVELDRTVEHFVKWQNVDYDATNPIYTFKIPSMPKIVSSLNSDSSITLTLDGDSDLRFAKTNFNVPANLSDGLYKQIIVDAFQGEDFSELLPLNVYYQNVLQGKIFASVRVNRALPDVPKVVLTSTQKKVENEKFFNARSDVNVNFISESVDQKIMYQVLGPFTRSLEQIQKGEFPKFKIDVENFVEYDNKQVLLKAKNDCPLLYVVVCYAVDKWNNTSDIFASNIDINMCDYFVATNHNLVSVENQNIADGNEDELNTNIPDGSYLNPFTDLSQLENIVNNNSYSRFYILNKVEFPKQKVSLKNNVKFVGLSNAEITFSENSSMYVIASNVEVENVLLKNLDIKSENNSIFFNLENAVLSIENSDVSFGRFQNATMISARNSVVNLKNSLFTTFSNDYACFAGLQNSKANISGCNIATGALTNVSFSCKDSNLVLENSICKVSGVNARIVELFNSKASVFNNSFSSMNLSTKSNVKNIPIWNDEFSVIDIRNNSVEGF